MPVRNSPREESTSSTIKSEWLFTRLPEWVVDSLTSRQKVAIDSAVGTRSWSRPPINIRFSVPFLTRRYYITVVSGEEKRTPKRLAEERDEYPLRTLANAFFFVGVLTAAYVVALIGLGVYNFIF
ncbi:MAG: hypothetical protein QGI06_04830 [Rhodospirillales bacterium]|nr:hypothetical protein [Rhodospirillales bacterium]